MIAFIEQSGYLESAIEGIMIRKINPYAPSEYIALVEGDSDLDITLENFYAKTRKHVTIVEFKQG